MRVVEVEDVDVAAAESEAGVGFPCMREAVDAVELDRAERVDGEAEHAASADGRELQWITDKHDTPGALVGERGEFCEFGSGDHAGFVDDHRRSCGQVEAMVGPSRQVVLDQQLVDGVRLDAGLDPEHLGGCGRGGHPEHRSSVESELFDGGRKRGGLAGTGRADDEHQLRSPGHCAGRHALWIGEVRRLDGQAFVVVFVDAETAVCPLDQSGFLVEHSVGGECPVDRRLGDGPAIAAQHRSAGDRARQVDAV